jgi:hypothetical protein
LIKLQQEQLLQVKKNELLAQFDLSEEQNETVRILCSQSEYLNVDLCVVFFGFQT